VDRIRFMSPHPFYVNDRFIAAVAETPAVCPHIHLPVQSGSNRVLERMRRNYTGGEFAAKVARLRAARPGLAVTTDWIVGFPGETEEDFEATLSLAEELDLDGAYSFKYSSRPGTASAAWADDVPEIVKEERHKRLLGLVDGQNRRKAAALAGTAQEVLVESRRADGLWQCRTAHNRILIAAGDARGGELRSVRVESVEGKTLHGRF
jgi:tRNA-2-methylthio-N6-dimethylallyladenosine synthase